MKEISQALVNLQAELEPVEKNAKNPFFKSEYMTLSQIMTSIQPLLKKHKLAVSQFVTSLDGQTGLNTILFHESGESIETGAMPLLLVKNDPQAQGSAITYARRYAICALLGIVADEDDDGNKATAAVAKAPASDKQKAFIANLLEAKGVETEDMIGFVKEQYNMDLKTLTLDSAKELIGLLQ